MIFPAFWAKRCAAAARQPLKTPVKFTSSMKRQSSGVISTSGATLATPELLTTMCRPPSSRIVRWTSASTSA